MHGLLLCKALDHCGLHIKFGDGMCKIIHHDGTIVAESLKDTGCLYYLCTTPASPQTPDPTAALATTTSFDLLHKWLAHPGKDALQLMIQKGIVDGLPDVADDAKEFNCTACIKGKMMHSPFQTGHKTMTEHLGRLHSDICGPMDTLSLGKNHYFCLLVDDKTRYLWFLPCAKKSDFTAWFTCLDALFANHYHSHTRILHTDQGGEYVNETLESYCTENSIDVELTIPHTPEQNWGTEHSNQRVLDKG